MKYTLQFHYLVNSLHDEDLRRKTEEFRLEERDIDDVASSFVFGSTKGEAVFGLTKGEATLRLSQYIGFHLKRKLARAGKIKLVCSVISEGFGSGYVEFVDACAKKIIEKMIKEKE